MIINSNIGVIIMAGGQSDRMNYPKLWLKTFNNINFIQSLINNYKKFGCEKIIVVINANYCKSPWEENLNEINEKAIIIRNNNPQKGRFHSLRLAAKHVGALDYTFIQNVDNPFAPQKLLTMLASNKNKDGYVVPTFHTKGGHPILVSNKIIYHISSLKNDDVNLKKLLGNFERSEVAVSWKEILYNINTKEDYESYLTQPSLDNNPAHANQHI